MKKGHESLSDHVLILDSSFNPPHKAHTLLINQASQFYGKSESTVILMLLVNNADKVVPKPVSFEERLAMMQCVAEDLSSTKNGLSVWVCLTKLAKFTDKHEAFRKEILGTKSSKISFLVGYDTLVRILDTKYYGGKLLEEALSLFMNGVDLVAVARGDKLFAEQKQELDLIDVPASWKNKLILLEPESEFLSTLSLSEIRKAVEEDIPGLALYLSERVVEGVKQLIIDRKYYKTKE